MAFEVTSDAAGVREDLSNFIYNISPVDTPMLQAAEWTTATNTIHQWTEDTLAAASSGNAWKEGEAKNTSAVTSGTTLANNTQISRKDYGVSGTVEVVTKAGRDSEIRLGQAKAMRELKRDMDAVICRSDQTKVTGDASTAGKLGALECWVRNADRASDGADPSEFTGAANDTKGTVRNFTQSLLDLTIDECFTNGANPSLLVMGPTGRKDFNTFDGLGNGVGSSTKRTDSSDKTTFNTVDVYMSSFGIELKAVNSRHLRTGAGTIDRDAWLIDPEHLKVPFLRSFQVTDFARAGDSIEQSVLAEYTLEVSNTYAHGLVADLGG